MKRPDVKAKLKETINSPEFKVRHSASAKKSWQRPEVRSRHVESMNRPEVKVKISDLTRKAYQDPEVRAKVSGANSPRWRGGVSFLPYCPKFNESRKEEVRNGYERVCANCERTELLELHRLSVHHVDGDKMQGCKGSEWFGLDGKWFLVPLCQSCHGKGLEYDPYSVGKFWLGELARRYREKRLVSQDAG